MQRCLTFPNNLYLSCVVSLAELFRYTRQISLTHFFCFYTSQISRVQRSQYSRVNTYRLKSIVTRCQFSSVFYDHAIFHMILKYTTPQHHHCIQLFPHLLTHVKHSRTYRRLQDITFQKSPCLNVVTFLFFMRMPILVKECLS